MSLPACPYIVPRGGNRVNDQCGASEPPGGYYGHFDCLHCLQAELCPEGWR